MLVKDFLTSHLDHLVRPTFSSGRRRYSAYKICGYLGLTSAILLAVSLSLHRALSVWTMVGIVLVAVLSFVTLGMITKLITGEESYTCYHHQICVLLVTVALLSFQGEPVLPYLDVTILGLGMFLACGRVGCLMVGCCHGRPHHWGVRYREEHAAAGFPDFLVGVRLFPIQGVESIWVLDTVIVGSLLVLAGSAPGEALAWYIISYGTGRFYFEFLRGDRTRPYFVGFSEAQWTSLLLMGALLATESLGFVPFHLWHWFVVGAIGLTMILLSRRRAAETGRSLQALTPVQVRELAPNLIARSDSR